MKFYLVLKRYKLNIYSKEENMIGIKCVILLLIIMTSSIIGNLYSQKFVKRVKELQEIKSALNMFRTKIKYTYEPIPDIFQDRKSVV